MFEVGGHFHYKGIYSPTCSLNVEYFSGHPVHVYELVSFSLQKYINLVSFLLIKYKIDKT